MPLTPIAPKRLRYELVGTQDNGPWGRKPVIQTVCVTDPSEVEAAIAEFLLQRPSFQLDSVRASDKAA